MSKRAAVLVCVLSAGAAGAQSPVDYTSSGWQDFGNVNDPSVIGNFLPGWSHVQGTPDVGPDPFGVPVQTLSGAADDGALWMNQYDSSNLLNEVARLDLSGFVVGEQYELTYSATLVHAPNAGWIGVQDRVEIEIEGADIASATSSLLFDGADDGMNDWVAQSIVFVAMSEEIGFVFGGGAVVDDPAGVPVSRLGVDGFDLIPGPGSSLLGAGLVLMAARRRR